MTEKQLREAIIKANLSYRTQESEFLFLHQIVNNMSREHLIKLYAKKYIPKGEVLEDEKE